MSKVLVTGGTGFIAGHCIRELLKRGYNVVTTVRSDSKGARVLEAHSASHTGGSKLSYTIVEDVAQEGAFDEIIRSTPDLDFVMHTASPFHYNVQDPVKDFLEPAVTGTTSILKAIKMFNSPVKRVVLTSSFAAIRDDSKQGQPLFDESCWNPVTWEEAAQNAKKTYQGSKKLAEQAAWDFMEKEQPKFDLVTINPSLVFGPAAPHLSQGDLSQLNTSNVRILDMLQGKMKEKLAPTGFYTWVDVRDVALAHVEALTSPRASGKRFLMIAGYYSNKQIASVVAAMGTEYRDRLPVDLEALEDDLPGSADRYTFNCQQSVDILGCQYTTLAESVRDTANSLLELRA